MAWQITPFDPKSGTDEEFEEMCALANIIRAQAMPTDPPTKASQFKLQLQNIPAVFELHMWLVRDESGRLLATGDVGFINMDTNQHLAQFDIDVLPDSRGKGIATALLGEIAAKANGRGRSLLISTTRSSVPAAEAFMKRIGATVGLSSHVNELKTAEIDRNLLREWPARAKERAQGFSLGLWDGRYPEEHLQEIAQMKELINTMPKEDLDMDDIHFTAEHLREMDDSDEATGAQRWCMYIREDATGKLAGYTELYWHPSKPEIANQADTAVLEEYKNRGLGRWLKAAMLEKLLEEHPEVTIVRTGNAQSNKPMLNINNELGFRSAVSAINWQVPVERALAFTAARLG
jgi:mycothiol synthase